MYVSETLEPNLNNFNSYFIASSLCSYPVNSICNFVQINFLNRHVIAYYVILPMGKYDQVH